MVLISSIIYIRLLNSNLPLSVSHLRGRNNQIIQGRFILSHPLCVASPWKISPFRFLGKLGSIRLCKYFEVTQFLVPRSFSPQKARWKLFRLTELFFCLICCYVFFFFFFFSLNAVRLIGRLFYFEHIARARDLKNQLTAITPPKGWGRGFLLGMCRWHLRAPTPIMTILWPIVDPIFVTFGQICNFRDTNIESLSIFMN